MKAKHTPGPWEVRIHDKGPYFTEVEIWHQNYGLLTRMPDNTSIWNSDKNEVAAKEALEQTIANATLMAVAPEMLGVCQLVLESHTDGPYITAGKWMVHDLMKMVVKKVTS